MTNLAHSCYLRIELLPAVHTIMTSFLQLILALSGVLGLVFIEEMVIMAIKSIQLVLFIFVCFEFV